MIESFCRSDTDPKWWSEVNLVDPYFELVIVGFQAGLIGRSNGIHLNPWSELVILGPTASCCSLHLHI
jgi:hypothetical protein